MKPLNKFQVFIAKNIFGIGEDIIRFQENYRTTTEKILDDERHRLNSAYNTLDELKKKVPQCLWANGIKDHAFWRVCKDLGLKKEAFSFRQRVKK